MRDVVIAIIAASYSGNKGAAAMLQSSIKQLHDKYESALNIRLMSVYPSEDKKQVPWDYVDIVSSKPKEIIFIAFPLAVLFYIFKFVPFIKILLLKNKVLKSYYETDLAIDEAGISFADSRGFIMNTYAFITIVIPMLMGVPVVKYSQAMGSFNNAYNRTLAKIILPKLKLICARGKETYNNLKSIGINNNVKLITDGAFSMEDDLTLNRELDKLITNDLFFKSDNIVGVSLSSVVEKRCNKKRIDYHSIMADFIDRLCERGYNVFIIANSARINSNKSHNNDLLVCNTIYNHCKNKSKIKFINKEMKAEEIRYYIGKCKYIVGSRFHAMIAALHQKKPVLLVGWSHKYQEVLDLFKLSNYSIDYSKLTSEKLLYEFDRMIEDENNIIESINKNYDSVISNSYENIKYISSIIDKELDKPYPKELLDFRNPDKYIGNYLKCRMGYANDEKIRKKSASGGIVTAFLCYLLRSNKIDGVLVTRTNIIDNKVVPLSFIATKEEEIKDSGTSVYMNFNILKHIDEIEKFKGKIAVVMVPCMLKGLNEILKNNNELNKKIILKIGLFCSGSPSSKLTDLIIKKSRSSLENAKRFYYRLGHWRGQTTIVYEDNSVRKFSYKKLFSAYKNAFFFEENKCVLCQDQYAKFSDISFGDIWLSKMKKNPIKHTCVVIRNKKANQLYNEAVRNGYIIDEYISNKDVIMGQKRSLVYKYRCAEAKLKYNSLSDIDIDISDSSKWNHKLAYKLASINRSYSHKNNNKLDRIPTFLIYYYMLFIRFLLNF